MVVLGRREKELRSGGGTTRQPLVEYPIKEPAAPS